MDRVFQLAGFDVFMQIENDKWCRRVLEKIFESGIKRYGKHSQCESKA